MVIEESVKLNSMSTNFVNSNASSSKHEYALSEILIMKRLLKLMLLLFASIVGAAHGAPGDLYVAEPTGGGHIYKFAMDGTRITVASGIYQTVALAFDRAGNLFVGNSGAGTSPQPSTIIKITPDGVQSTFATFPSSELLSMAFDGAGNLFVSGGGAVAKIAPDASQSLFARVSGAWPLAFDRSGALYVGSNPIGPSSIIKVLPDGSQATVAKQPQGPSESIVALAFAPNGDLYFILGGAIWKLTVDGAMTQFATGSFKANSLAFDTAGHLFAGMNAYGSSSPAIIKFQPDGSSTVFANGVLLPNGFAFEPVTEKLRNISARAFVDSGDSVLIGGFIVGGSALANNAVVIRAIGPSLTSAGVTKPLSNPILELHDSTGATIMSNDDWQTSQAAQISATGLAPSDSHEAAIFATLPFGNYTAVVRSSDGSNGTALVEVYSVAK